MQRQRNAHCCGCNEGWTAPRVCAHCFSSVSGPIHAAEIPRWILTVYHAARSARQRMGMGVGKAELSSGTTLDHPWLALRNASVMQACCVMACAFASVSGCQLHGNSSNPPTAGWVSLSCTRQAAPASLTVGGCQVLRSHTGRELQAWRVCSLPLPQTAAVRI